MFLFMHFNLILLYFFITWVQLRKMQCYQMYLFFMLGLFIF